MTSFFARSIRVSLLIALGIVSFVYSEKRLWILSGPDQIVEYDIESFLPLWNLRIPSEVFRTPGRFSVNRQGQMLFSPASLSSLEIASPRRSLPEIWYWNGKEALSFEAPGIQAADVPTSRNVSLRLSIQYVLSADGSSLFSFERKYRTLHQLLPNGRKGAETKVEAAYEIGRTELSTLQRFQVSTFTFPACECLTGACLETCPDAEIWASEAGIEDFFLLTHLTHGQLSTEYHASFLFLSSNETWSRIQLHKPLEQLLDVGNRGDPIVAGIPDGGCCGWDNESNDRTLLIRGNTSVALFDERGKYNNPDYDVGFFTPTAKLSPNGRLVALTIVSTTQNASTLRLSSDGEIDEGQLASIRGALTRLPETLVFSTNSPPQELTSLPKAYVIGWISDSEFLLVEDGHIVIFDIQEGKRRSSKIDVAHVGHVFLR